MTNASFGSEVEWIVEPGLKLAVDFAPVSRPLAGGGADMDSDDRDLIVRLCTKAGCMMEDASAVSVTAAGLSTAQLRSTVDDLVAVAADIHAVMTSAAAIARNTA